MKSSHRFPFVTLLLALGSLPSAVPIGVANAASLVSSSQTQVYSIQTRGLLFNGAGAGPNVTVTSKFHPTGVVNWFNSLGGNITMTPPLATAVVQFNATVFAYVATGISSDHECVTVAEAREKLSRGLYILIREASNAHNLDALLPLINPTNCRLA